MAQCIFVFPNKEQCPLDAVAKGFCNIHLGDGGGGGGRPDDPKGPPKGGIVLSTMQKAALYAAALEPIIKVLKEVYHIVAPHLPRFLGSAPEHRIDVKKLLTRAEDLHELAGNFTRIFSDGSTDTNVEDAMKEGYGTIEADFIIVMTQLATVAAKVAAKVDVPEPETR